MSAADERQPALLIVIASTRPGRVGLPVGRWFEDRARAHGGFRVTVADLAELRLPLVDEPNHPRLRKYTQPHTRKWSEIVDAADAFAFVMPEYNYSFTAPLKNAIDYLHQEWQYKPVGLVSYGGVSAGTRAAAALGPAHGGQAVPAGGGRLDPLRGPVHRRRRRVAGERDDGQVGRRAARELVRVSEALAVLRG